MQYASVVFYQIIIMLILCCIGMVYHHFWPLSKHDTSTISRIISMVLSAGLILSGGTMDYSAIPRSSCIAAIIIGFSTYLGLLAIGFVLGHFLGRTRSERVIYAMLCSFGNVGFFGIPLVNAAYGPEIAIYMYFFIIPCNVCSYTLGYMMLNALKTERFQLDIHRLLNPGAISCLVVIICFLFNWQFPEIPAKIVGYLTTASTPMAMFLVGVALYNTNWRLALTNWRMLLFCLIRQLLLPLAAGLILRQFISDPGLLGVSLIMWSLPIGNATILLAEMVGIETTPGPETVSLSTVASVVTIPLLLYILL